MKSHVLGLAALAAIGFSGAAFAGEATQQGKTAGPVAMSDSELDKVTAGTTFIDVLATGRRITIEQTTLDARQTPGVSISNNCAIEGCGHP